MFRIDDMSSMQHNACTRCGSVGCFADEAVDAYNVSVSGTNGFGREDTPRLFVAMTDAQNACRRLCNAQFADGQMVSFHDNGTDYIGTIIPGGVETNPHNRIAVDVVGVGRMFIHPTRNNVRHYHLAAGV